MDLKARTVLQSSKYVIEEILAQDNVGITCKATHLYLDQPVILQTFNQAALLRDDFAQLKQQFMARVRSLVKQPSVSLRILDCFQEDDRPFIVLPFVAGASVPQLGDWLSVSSPQPIAFPQPVAVPGGSTADAQTTPPAPELDLSKPLETDEPLKRAHPDLSSVETATAPVMATAFHTEFPTVHVSPKRGSSSTLPLGKAEEAGKLPVLPNLQAFASQSDRSTTGKMNGAVGQLRSPQIRSNPTKQVPVALMVIAIAGGFVGAGAGVGLRLAAVPQEDGKPRLGFFNREQSFPAEGNWPIQERAIYTTPETTIEQPLYRTNAPYDYSSPTVEPLPEDVLPSYSSPIPDVEAPSPTAELEDDPMLSDPGLIEPKAVEPLPDPNSIVPEDLPPAIDSLPQEIPSAPIVPVLPADPEPIAPPPNDSESSSTSSKPFSDSLSIFNQ